MRLAKRKESFMVRRQSAMPSASCSIELPSESVKIDFGRKGRLSMAHTGVRKDSATKRALAFSYNEVSIRKLADNPRISYEKFHLRDLLVDLFHELYDKVHQFVLQHFFRMGIRDQE